MRLPNWLPWVVSVALSLPLAPAMAGERAGHGFQRSISVQGVGVVSARPDMAVISAGVTGQAVTAKAALSDHTKAMAALLTALRGFGIADRDVQSQHVSLHPVYPKRSQNGSARAPIAFRASGNVRVRLRQVDRLGELMDGMTGAGVNNLSGLHFAIAKPEPLQDQARVRALGDANRRARLYAAEAGVELGPVLRIKEGGAIGRAPRFRAMAAVSTERAIAPGETEIRMTVSVVYAIKDME